MEKLLSSPHGERILLSTEEIAVSLGISRNHFENMLADGRIGPDAVYLGRRCLWSLPEFRSWAAAGCPGRAAWQEKHS